MQRTILTILTLLITSNAIAGQSPWVDVAPNTRLRMIFSDELSAENKTMIAMELEMPQGSKTYWRVPGETGIPFQFNLAQSDELSTNKIIWPYPERDAAYGFVDFVYHQNLILPIELNVDGQNPVLQANLTLGVCSDICMPVNVKIEHQLNFDKQDRRTSFQISQAMATTPIKWDQGESPVGAPSYNPGTQQIIVPIRNSDLDIESLIATIGDSSIVFGAPKKNSEGSSVTFDKLGGGDILDLAEQPLTLTFMSKNGPYEISQPLEIIQ